MASWKKGTRNFMAIANNRHPAIKFATTINENEIPFPDTTIYREGDDYIFTRMHCKPTDSKLCLHYTSAHPWKQKSILYGLLMRCKILCSEKKYFEQEAKNFIQKLEEENIPINYLKHTKK